MKRIVCLSLLLILSAPFSLILSQKAYKPIRTLLKEKKGKEALTKVKELEIDSAYKDDPKLYDLGKLANMLIYEKENEKLYLTKQCDTISFFQSIYGIYDYILKCESKEKMLLEKEHKKPKYRKSNQSIIHTFYKNIGAGGRYFFKKKNFEETINFLDFYLEITNSEIWGKRDDLISKKAVVHSAYMYQKSAYLSGNYDKVIRYNSLTLNDSSFRKQVIDLLAKTSECTHDTIQMLKYLKQGITEYSDDPSFFNKIYDYYIAVQQNDLAYTLADSLSTIYPDSTLYNAAKVLPLVRMGRYHDAIEAGEQVLEVDTLNADLHYYVGLSYCVMADSIKLPTSINSKSYRTKSKEKKDYYLKALPHLEQYRNKYPDDVDKWGKMLHDVYWGLNMGKQYDDILKILK